MMVVKHCHHCNGKKLDKINPQAAKKHANSKTFLIDHRVGAMFVCNETNNNEEHGNQSNVDEFYVIVSRIIF